MTRRVAVVGAGIAGVASARALAAAGVEVILLERARSPGGRMASRTIEGRRVDTGAAYFTVAAAGFAAVVADWEARGLARPWTDALAVWEDGTLRPPLPGPVRWAAPGGLRSLVADLAAGLPLRLTHPVAEVGPGPTVDGTAYDGVVLAMPDPQALRLLAPALDAERAVLAGREWEPVLSLLAGWRERAWELDAAFVNGHPVLALVADDGRRRGDGAAVLVAHSTGRRPTATNPSSWAPTGSRGAGTAGAAPGWRPRGRAAPPPGSPSRRFSMADRFSRAARSPPARRRPRTSTRTGSRSRSRLGPGRARRRPPRRGRAP